MAGYIELYLINFIYDMIENYKTKSQMSDYKPFIVVIGDSILTTLH